MQTCTKVSRQNLAVCLFGRVVLVSLCRHVLSARVAVSLPQGCSASMLWCEALQLLLKRAFHATWKLKTGWGRVGREARGDERWANGFSRCVGGEGAELTRRPGRRALVLPRPPAPRLGEDTKRSLSPSQLRSLQSQLRTRLPGRVAVAPPSCRHRLPELP